MANRGYKNRTELPRRIRHLLALQLPTADAHQLGAIKRLFIAASAHAQSVDRYVLPGHAGVKAAEVEADIEVAAKAAEVAKNARSIKSEETPAT